MELGINSFFGSVAPEGHHLEPHHGRTRDRPLQDQQEVNFGGGGTQKSLTELHSRITCHKNGWVLSRKHRTRPQTAAHRVLVYIF